MAIGNSATSCNVCGSSVVQHDEVFDGGRVILSECNRCRHRWTQARPVPAAAQLLRARRSSIAAAAEVALAS